MPPLLGVVMTVEKALLFHKLNLYLKWKRGLSPLFQAFFPLPPDFFLNQAAVFRQSPKPLAERQGAFYAYVSGLCAIKLVFHIRIYRSVRCRPAVFHKCFLPKAQLFINVLGAVVGEQGAHFNARKALFE